MISRIIGICFAILLLAFAHPELSPYLSLLSSMGGYALLWYMAQTFQQRKIRAGMLFFSFAIVYAVHFSWLARPEYHGFPILILYTLLTGFYAISMMLLSLLVIEKKATPLQAIGCAAWFVFFEWAMAHFLCGFTIDQIGLHLLWHPIAAQTSAFLGGFFLTFLVIYTNILVYLSISNKSIRSYAIVALLFPYLFGIPQYYLKEKAIRHAETFSIGVLQTGLRPEEKRPLPGKLQSFLPIDRQWKNILQLAKKIKTKKILDLVVLPEAALPFGATAPCLPQAYAEQLIYKELGEIPFPQSADSFVQTIDGPYVTNSYLCYILSKYLNTIILTGLLHEENEKNFSCAFTFYPDWRKPEMYAKRLLVPIAEGVPFAFLKAISQKYGIVEYFTPGVSYLPFSGPVDILPNICYEEMRGDLIRRYSSSPQLFVNLSNDVWYPNSTLPHRHFMHAKLRAIENGVPYVRSCNTGISAALTPTGREIARIADRQGNVEWIKQSIVIQVPVVSYATPFAKYGDFPLFILLSGVIILDLLLRYRVSQSLKNNERESI